MRLLLLLYCYCYIMLVLRYKFDSDQAPHSLAAQIPYSIIYIYVCISYMLMKTKRTSHNLLQICHKFASTAKRRTGGKGASGRGRGSGGELAELSGSKRVASWEK